LVILHAIVGPIVIESNAVSGYRLGVFKKTMVSQGYPTEWSGNYDDLPAGSGQGHHQMAEGVAAFEGAPASVQDAAMSEEMDFILDRLRSGVPQLHREMDEFLAHVHRPGGL
jgi:hypothetical protein